MITEKVMMPVLLASNHPIVHLSLMIAGFIIIHDDHQEQKQGHCKEAKPPKNQKEIDDSINKINSLNSCFLQCMISHLICILLHVLGDLFSLYNQHINALINKDKGDTI